MERLALRLTGALIGFLCVEGAIFGVIAPVVVAALLASVDLARPDYAPAGWLVRAAGRAGGPAAPRAAVRSSAAIVLALCIVSIAADIAGSGVLRASSAVAAGVIGFLALASGRPLTELVRHRKAG